MGIPALDGGTAAAAAEVAAGCLAAALLLAVGAWRRDAEEDALALARDDVEAREEVEPMLDDEDSFDTPRVPALTAALEESDARAEGFVAGGMPDVPLLDVLLLLRPLPRTPDAAVREEETDKREEPAAFAAVDAVVDVVVDDVLSRDGVGFGMAVDPFPAAPAPPDALMPPDAFFAGVAVLPGTMPCSICFLRSSTAAWARPI